ncbi:MAG: phosphopentomutase [Acholeplasmatales bacterium]|jgi:phosphopentomutase|nr:phosphopentomutase [Acholeplasmataceae bacterium]MDY0115617.1 phosphopentomutase [Acholeplasmatales bacterium]MCK9233602.1 phosphopentomutase [Acholeplasmataceae bacterium]MCK9289451.1 phosphopentomutase [Acholeplasmataceae bacterium]MCK9427935.1 phosphopentomutase [Acholeplasmataceae bacterium]
MFKRIFLIVMDSLGCGEAPDASDFNDVGANTIYHISEHYKLTIPHLQSLGYSNLTKIKDVAPIKDPRGVFGVLEEQSSGKDTMTGHWEIMGLLIKKPFKTFTETGFPQELIAEIEAKTNRKTIGNYAASGTEIIKELGEEHLKTGALIIYTSADSVLQIAMHEDVIPLKEQYQIAEICREITLKEEYKVARIITRPFIGTNKDNFTRTANRHDYALKPPEKTTLNYLSEAGLEVIAIGKINDIFVGEGITSYQRTVSNLDGMNKTIELAINNDFKGLCFVNLVDFDALYGHRRNPIGYGQAIDEFDVKLGELLTVLKDDDLVILTADHGNDPTFRGTDHTRELVPFIAYNPQMKSYQEIEKGYFADIGKTIAENFKINTNLMGKSILKILKEAKNG